MKKTFFNIIFSNIFCDILKKKLVEGIETTPKIREFVDDNIHLFGGIKQFAPVIADPSLPEEEELRKQIQATLRGPVETPSNKSSSVSVSKF